MKTKHLHALQSTRKIALHALCNCFDDLLGYSGYVFFNIACNLEGNLNF
jgi:hypothetical protein